MKLLVKQKHMPANAPIPCAVVTDENVTELSLAENALQCPMHPADQFDAFHALSREYGMSAEDIAARFGVTASVVKQRLKLAAISPKLIEAYRQDEINLDQLTAFAITDDHAKQEKVWAALEGQDNDREDLLAALTDEEVLASDPVARFVGKEAYVAAGGIIVRDLFDTEREGYFADVNLLDDLANAKFEAAAETLRAEGWKWVTTMRRYDYGMIGTMRRIYPRPVPPSDEAQAQFDALQGEYDLLLDQEESEARETELQRLELALDALRGEDVFTPEEIGIAGAIITLTHAGELRIERGLIKPEDDPGSPRKPRAAQERPVNTLSAKLVGELTAHQTMSLRDALGENGEAALVAITHALAAALFLPGESTSCLAIRADSRCLDGLVPGIAESPAGQRIAARHEKWAQHVPDAASLWGFVTGLDTADRLALLAHCVGLSVDTVRMHEAQAKDGLADLATSVSLDMCDDWQPTAASYLGRVSRACILDAVREGVSPAAADNLAGLKKAALAAEAERRLKETGWLPPILRTAA